MSLNNRVGDALLRIPCYLWLRELISDPAAIGAICSSSASLANRMSSWVDPVAEGWVIELGGGTGAITAALLQHGIAVNRLIVIEKSKRLARHLCMRFPGIHVHHGDASDINMMRKSELLSVTTIVSGLPLRSMPPYAVKKITSACALALGPEGRLIQFAYWPRTPSAWLAAGLTHVGGEIVWGNLPPARIDVFTHSGICLQ